MENCLVTTLKDGITDSDLLKIGEIRAEYAKAGTNSNNIRSVESQDIVELELLCHRVLRL